MAIVQYRHLNVRGDCIGESHPKAKLSDREVAEIRDMHERLGMSSRSIARMLEVPRRTVRCILSYENRSQPVATVIEYVRPE